MNILLIGEFSRLHNSLKEGLNAMGHHVVICGLNDGFKDYPVDLPIKKKWDSGWLKKIKSACYRLTGFDISSWLTYRQFQRYKDRLKGFDVVQLINENSFYCQPDYEIKILSYLFANNHKAFLLSCGYDYANVHHALAHPEMKSPLQPYLQGKIGARDFDNALKYTRPDFKKLHDFIYTSIRGVIASDLDYEPALLSHPKYLGLIPNPINVDQIKFLPLAVEDAIVIFHGINQQNYLKKGNDYFERALAVITDRYPDRIEVITVRNAPYSEYIKSYDRAHIILDQVYAMDQGYNALEAMAKGKVVFTGAEQSFVNRYQIQQAVNCNSVPDVDRIVEQLADLIAHPDQIVEIGGRARRFIESEHDYRHVATQYLQCWERA